MDRCFSAVTVVILSLVLAAPASGQRDDFEDGTTQGWSHGMQNPNAPRVYADGGPGGMGDSFLLVESTGGGFAGSRLAMFNRDDRWTVDFTPFLGSPLLVIDLNNLGSALLNMRFMFEGDGGNVFTSGFELPPNGGWQQASFSLVEEDLFSDGEIGQTLSRVSKLWLIHSDEATHPAPPIEATLGVDNITLTGLPIEYPMADYNNNGAVEQADLNLVLLNWGEAYDTLPAEWVNERLAEGIVDQAELNGVLLNWGDSIDGAVAVAVPEPPAVLLLIVTCSSAAACAAVLRRAMVTE